MIDEIKKFQIEIDLLKDRQQEMVFAAVADPKRYTLLQRFEVWSKYATKKEEPWVINESQYPIIGKMVDECYPCDYNKYREYSWEFFLEAAIDNFEESQDPEFCNSKCYKPRFITQASIDALKEEMMTLNFGSFEMDW